MTRLERMQAVDSYIAQHCDINGVMENSEIVTEKEQAGKDEIMEGVRNKGWLIYQLTIY